MIGNKPRSAVTAGVVVSKLAGAWYDADPDRLARFIDAGLQSAPPPAGDRVCAAILPHAGYRYSGRIAALGAARLRGRRPSRVVVMGPAHRGARPHRMALTDATAFETPLGRLPVDREAVRALQSLSGFEPCPPAFEGEHSVEIQLPILQRAIGEFKLLPLVSGRLDANSAADIAAGLRNVIDPETLVIVSSDFTHYGENFGYLPFDRDIEENIRRLDEGAFAEIVRLDCAAFIAYCRRTGATICGRDPIAVLLAMLSGGCAVERVAYATSGGLTGDFSHCVSYLAAVFKTPSGSPWTAPVGGGVAEGRAQLDGDERRALVRLARDAIAAALEKGRPPVLSAMNFKPSAAQREHRGAFVSLHLPGRRLRGCIGEIFPRRPLFEAVFGNALQSAFHDPRFPPLDRGEWPRVAVEVSALTPPRPVASASEIVPGRHGVVLEKDGAAAVFLPQVATEQNWNLEQMLTHLALKAGLPPDAWRAQVCLAVFEAEVF